MSGPIEIMFHIQFEPNFSDAASAPITEVATWYFPTSYDTHEWDTGVVKFNKTLRESAEGFHGVSSGWSIDDVPHKSLEDVGGKGKAFVLAVGWESLEAHTKYRDTDAFKETIGLLRNKSKGVEMVSRSALGFENQLTEQAPRLLQSIKDEYGLGASSRETNVCSISSFTRGLEFACGSIQVEGLFEKTIGCQYFCEIKLPVTTLLVA